MSEEPELKPCPFCGDDQRDFAGMTEGAFGRSSDGCFCVCCECGTTGPFGKTMNEAIAAWNTRADTATRIEGARMMQEAAANAAERYLSDSLHHLEVQRSWQTTYRRNLTYGRLIRALDPATVVKGEG